jgi:prepilin-type N-terminal cleavage/methylation domain-containing protein
LKARRRQAGFSFVEVLVAVAVLALCAGPLAGAVKSGIDASRIGTAKARELRCMRNTMEAVLAESYQTLSDAARGKDTPSAWAPPADASCDIARTISIAKYEYEYGKSPVFLDASAGEDRLAMAMLYVTVSSPDSGYAFTTLVSR